MLPAKSLSRHRVQYNAVKMHFSLKLPPSVNRTVHSQLTRILHIYPYFGLLGSLVVSVVDSGAEGPGSNRSHATHCASVHQAAKLVASLLRVAGVTAGLAESNGSLPSGL